MTVSVIRKQSCHLVQIKISWFIYSKKHLMASSRKTVTNLWLPNILWHWSHNNLLSFQRAQDFRESQKNGQKSCLRAEEHLQLWLFQTNNRFCISPPRSVCTLTVQDSGAETSSNLRDFVWKNGPKSLEHSVRPVSPYRRRREALITASA